MKFATSFIAKHEKIWQSKTCFQRRFEKQSIMHELPATSRPWSTSWNGWIKSQISWKIDFLVSRQRINVPASSISKQEKSCLRFLWRPKSKEPFRLYKNQRFMFEADSSPACAQRKWAIWRRYWQARQSQQFSEWDILDTTMVLIGSFGRGNLEGLMRSSIQSSSVSAKLADVIFHRSTGLASFSVVVLSIVNLLSKCKQIGNPRSSSNLYMAVDKLPQVLHWKCWSYVDDKDEKRPVLAMVEKMYL